MLGVAIAADGDKARFRAPVQAGGMHAGSDSMWTLALRVGDCSKEMLAQLATREAALVSAQQTSRSQTAAVASPIKVMHHSVGHECGWGGAEGSFVGWGGAVGSFGIRDPQREAHCSRDGRCRAFRVMRTMSESADVPANDVRCCKLADETWVPTEWHRAIYTAAGCPDVHVLGESVDSTNLFLAESGELLPESGGDGSRDGRAPFVFLSNFRWTARKGYKSLLRAYWSEFSADDAVELRLRTYMSPWDVYEYPTVQAELAAIRKNMGIEEGREAKVSVLSGELDRHGLAAMYHSADAFVLPSRGEGWGLPAMEAIASGRPAIVTNFSGFTGFCDSSTAFAMVSVTKEEGTADGTPSVPELRAAMRALVDRGKEGAALFGARAAEELRRHHAPSVLAATLAERLEHARGRMIALRRAEAEAGVARGEPRRADWSAAESAVNPLWNDSLVGGSHLLARSKADKERLKKRHGTLERARQEEKRGIGVGSSHTSAAVEQRERAERRQRAGALMDEIASRASSDSLIRPGINDLIKGRKGSRKFGGGN